MLNLQTKRYLRKSETQHFVSWITTYQLRSKQQIMLNMKHSKCLESSNQAVEYVKSSPKARKMLIVLELCLTPRLLHYGQNYAGTLIMIYKTAPDAMIDVDVFHVIMQKPFCILTACRTMRSRKLRELNYAIPTGLFALDFCRLMADKGASIALRRRRHRERII